jgi:2-dehydro-3-deoxygalactonokinase
VADTRLIGLDWGTTQLRAYRFAGDGEVAESRELPAGILRVTGSGASPGDATAGFERAFDDACGDWWRAAPSSPVIACGMIGSAQGWREAAYVDVPTGVDALGRALAEVRTQGGAVLRIIPGLIARGPLPEVMRGEETQVAGAFAGGPAAPIGDAWIGLPGTHSKWVRLSETRITQFHTFMTGEIFAALCAHTILGRTMRTPAAPDLAAFDRGVDVARSPLARAGVLSTIFSARTLGLTGALPADAQADYLSGLLVGHEVAAIDAVIAERSVAPDASIVLVGSAELCERYRRALVAFGHAPPTIAAGATARGLWRVARSAGLVSGSPSC